MVTAAVDEAHSSAALKVLSTPDLLITVALGGDHMTDGLEALHTALDNPSLRPHFQVIEAKRLGRTFGKRKADAQAAAALIDANTVMSPSEIRKVALIVDTMKRDDRRKAAVKKAIDALRKGAKSCAASDDVTKLVVDLAA